MGIRLFLLTIYLISTVWYGSCWRNNFIFNSLSPIPSSLKSQYNDFLNSDSIPIKCICKSKACPKDSCKNSSDDASFIAANECGVFDGVGSWNKLGVDCGKYTSFLATSCQAILSVERNSIGKVRGSKKREINLVQVLNFAAENAKRNNFVGSTTVCMVSIDDVQQCANILNLGDSGAYIFRRSKETVTNSNCRAELIFRTESRQHFFDTPFQIGNGNNIPMAANYFSELNSQSFIVSSKVGSIPFDKPSDSSVRSIPVEVGDVLLVATDGLFDNIRAIDLINIIANNIYEKIDENSDSRYMDDAIELTLQALLETAQINAVSHSVDNITPWSVATTKEILRIRRQIETSIFALGKNEWNNFEDYITGLPEFERALLASDSSYNKREGEDEVVVTMDAKCDAVKDLLGSKNYQSFLPTFLFGDSYSNYDYSEQTNSFLATVKIGSRTVPVRIKVRGGKPDDITIILVLIV